MIDLFNLKFNPIVQKENFKIKCENVNLKFIINNEKIINILIERKLSD